MSRLMQRALSPSARPLKLWYTRPPKHLIHLVLDWDGTLTRKDTLGVLVQIAALHRDAAIGAGLEMRSAPQQLPTGAEFMQQWDQIVKAYMDDYANHAESYRPEAWARKTVAEESAWLESLREVEDRSLERAVNAQIFAGLKHKALWETTKEALSAGSFELRDGWKSLFEACCKDSRSKVEILSVNWSMTFIRAALAAAASITIRGSDQVPDALRKYIENTPTLALGNDPQGLGHVRGSSGKLSNYTRPKVRTSADKVAQLPKPLKRGGKRLVVYIGDSATDFDALLAADVGICVRDKPLSSSQKELADTLERVGVDVRHVRYWNQRQTEKGRDNDVLWTRDLSEVAALLDKTIQLEEEE